ncbi:hypothetical protein LEP1GSC021_4249 [Leptospira noguchii str. 1993005606]|nr:hypothetical protein LEP1GSC021_4249 [Leptospira noguchii str. 1993005606]
MWGTITLRKFFLIFSTNSHKNDLEKPTLIYISQVDRNYRFVYETECSCKNP